MGRANFGRKEKNGKDKVGGGERRERPTVVRAQYESGAAEVADKTKANASRITTEGEDRIVEVGEL